MGGSLALAAATAVAFSGSLVIFSLCRAHLSHVPEPEPEPEPEEGAPEHALRPCLLSSERRPRGAKAKAKARRRRGEKRVRFAPDVVDNEGAPRPTRSSAPATAAASSSSAATCRDAAGSEERMMPANREALYRGMLRDRSAHRVTCSY